LAWDRHQICWLAYPVAWLISPVKEGANFFFGGREGEREWTSDE